MEVVGGFTQTSAPLSKLLNLPEPPPLTLVLVRLLVWRSSATYGSAQQILVPAGDRALGRTLPLRGALLGTLPTFCACFNISAGSNSAAAVLVPVSLSTMARFLSWAFSCSSERHLASQLGYWPPSPKIGYPVSQLATQFHPPAAMLTVPPCRYANSTPLPLC